MGIDSGSGDPDPQHPGDIGEFVSVGDHPRAHREGADLLPEPGGSNGASGARMDVLVGLPIVLLVLSGDPEAGGGLRKNGTCRRGQGGED